MYCTNSHNFTQSPNPPLHGTLNTAGGAWLDTHRQRKTVGVGGALDVRWYTKLRRFIYDHTHFPIYFTAALPMDLQLIGPELVVEIGVEIKRRKHTYS